MDKTILLTTCAWATLAAAAGEIDTTAEVAELNRIERAVNIHMIEMRMQAEEVSKAIRADLNEKFREPREAISRETEAIYAELRRIYREIQDLDTMEIYRKVRDDFRQKEEAAVSPLVAELEKRRAPIMEDVNRLRQEKNALEETHYENKRRYGALMTDYASHAAAMRMCGMGGIVSHVVAMGMCGVDDGYASHATGMRMCGIAERIKELFAGVDGDLPRRIDDMRSLFNRQMCEAKLEAKRIADAKIQELTQLKEALQMREKELGRQSREFYEIIAKAENAAMPNKHAMFGRIKQDLLLAVISEQVDKETFIATAEAA
jgi:hypothetical protein